MNKANNRVIQRDYFLVELCLFNLSDLYLTLDCYLKSSFVLFSLSLFMSTLFISFMLTTKSHTI